MELQMLDMNLNDFRPETPEFPICWLVEIDVRYVRPPGLTWNLKMNRMMVS